MSPYRVGRGERVAYLRPDASSSNTSRASACSASNCFGATSGLTMLDISGVVVRTGIHSRASIVRRSTMRLLWSRFSLAVFDQVHNQGMVEQLAHLWWLPIYDAGEHGKVGRKHNLRYALML